MATISAIPCWCEELHGPVHDTIEALVLVEVQAIACYKSSRLEMPCKFMKDLRP
jgi:hypothetical protein